MTRTTTLWAAIGLAMASIAPAAAAQFPEKPIQVIVPAGPGSATDTVTRLVLNKIAEQKTLGQPTVVVNVNGGPIAASRVKDAAPDGHEIMVYHIGLLSTKAVGKLAFGAEAFEPIAQTGSTQFLVAVAEGGPYKDFKALVDAARAKPNTITEGNVIGGASHIATLSLAQKAGYQARIVQVGDGPKRLQSVLGGHTAYTVVSPQEYKGFQGSGIRAIAVIGASRNPEWPDAPSTKELGYDINVSVDTWWFAPKGTPKAAVDKLADAIEKAMADPGLKDALAKQGVAQTMLRGEAGARHIAAVDATVQPLGPALGGQ
jgi:tripartite-type tricarboxylate transporter receptor subunit TctC